MKVNLSKELIVRMGPYENMRISAGVEVDTEREMPGTDDGAVEEYLRKTVEMFLAPHVEQAAAYTTYDDEDTFIHTYKQDQEKKHG